MTTRHESRATDHVRDATGRDRSVTICAWCPHIHILRLDRTALDLVLIVQEGGRLIVFRNGEALEVTHGICPVCTEKERSR